MILTMLAQASGGGSDTLPFLDFIDLGVLAALVIALIRGWLVVGREKEAIEKDKERALEEKKEAEEKFELYQQKVQDEVLPQLFETTRVLGEVMSMIKQLETTRELRP